MAKILFWSVLSCALLSFHAALGDGGWLISDADLDRVSQSSQDHVTDDICRALRLLHLGPLARGFSRSEITVCTVVSLHLQPNLLLGMTLTICVEVRVQCGPFFYMLVQLTLKLDIRAGPQGFFVYGCAVVDVKIIEENLLDVEVSATVIVSESVTAVLSTLKSVLCDKARLWCKDLNYCYDFNPAPFPIHPDCYCVWKNQHPFVREKAIVLRAWPECSCDDDDDDNGLLGFDLSAALQITTLLTDHSYFYCGENTLSYILECMRKGGSLGDLFTLGDLTVGILLDRLPKLPFPCPRTANLVVKIECIKIPVEMHNGYSLLYVVFRVSVGCDLSSFKPYLVFELQGSLSLHIDIDCRSQLLHLSVSQRSLFQVTSICKNDDDSGCGLDDEILSELFSSPLTSWCVSHFNVKLKVGISLPLMTYYTCDSCQTPVHVQHCVYSACKLHYRR